MKPIFGWFVLIMGIYIIIKETLLKRFSEVTTSLGSGFDRAVAYNMENNVRGVS